MRAAEGIERHDLRAERCAAINNRCCRYRIIQVRHFKFVDVPSLESDVPVIVELVIVGAAQPIQIVVTPHAAVDCELAPVSLDTTLSNGTEKEQAS